MEWGKFLDGLATHQTLTDEQIKENLEILVDTPMTKYGYEMAYSGVFELMRKCGVTEKDERFREYAYRKVLKMLETEPDLLDTLAKDYLGDYANSILSWFKDPQIPKEWASKLRIASEKYISRFGEDGAIKSLRSFLG